jgi:hypothetical protein
MSIWNRSILVISAVFCLCGADMRTAQAEEAKEPPNFYQPGAGYEKEPTYTFTGVIRKMPEQGKVGFWVIDDRLVAVSSMTVIDGPAAVGSSVTIKGLLQHTDFLALTITVTESKSADKKE